MMKLMDVVKHYLIVKIFPLYFFYWILELLKLFHLHFQIYKDCLIVYSPLILYRSYMILRIKLKYLKNSFYPWDCLLYTSSFANNAARCSLSLFVNSLWTLSEELFLILPRWWIYLDRSWPCFQWFLLFVFLDSLDSNFKNSFLTSFKKFWECFIVDPKFDSLGQIHLIFLITLTSIS